MDLPRRGTDDAHADRSLQSKRVAEGHHQLALAHPVGVTEFQGWQVRAFDFDDRHVHVPVHADQLGIQEFAFRFEDRTPGSATPHRG